LRHGRRQRRGISIRTATSGRIVCRRGYGGDFAAVWSGGRFDVGVDVHGVAQ
jgi:hypothetical protein